MAAASGTTAEDGAAAGGGAASGAGRSPAPAGRAGWLLHDPQHGPLPTLLLALTVVTGLVDAVSILALGRVFVANMTGNIAFIGFALAGAPGFALAGSVSALVGFLVGAGVGGLLVGRLRHRGHLLAAGATGELVLLGAALAVASWVGLGAGVARDAVAALAAVALGVQNAVGRSLAVPDLTTTVLTMTLTGLVADLRLGSLRPVPRRLLAVAALGVGAGGGAVLVLRVSPLAALGVVVVLLAVVALGALAAARRPAPWQHR